MKHRSSEIATSDSFLKELLLIVIDSKKGIIEESVE